MLEARTEATILAFKSSPAPRETEIKFDLDDVAQPKDGPAALLAALETLGGVVKDQTLVSTYYDDPDQTLNKAGFTLRVRDLGGALVQTIKTDAGGTLFSRGEWETQVKALEPDLDAARQTPLAEVLERAGKLRPVFTCHVQRLQRTAAFGGAEIEAAFDVGEVEADGGRRSPIRQLELELKQGSIAPLFALAKSLSEAAPLRLSFQTKAGLGYALLSPPARCAKSAPVVLDAGMTAGAAFQTIARASLHQIVANERILRIRRGSEALHQLRVGLRRLRTAQALFKPVVTDAAFEQIKGDLKWLSGQLDEGRDTDVFVAETYRPAADALGEADGMAALGQRLKQVQTRAYDRALKALKSRRGVDINLRLAEWIEAGAWLAEDEASQSVAHFADGVLHRLDRKAAKKGRNLTALAPPERHQLRIAIKKLRYGLEFFGTLYPPKRTRKLLELLKAYQASLGVLNDIAVARRTAAKVAEGAPSTQIAFAAGLAAGRRADAESDPLKQAVALRKGLRAAPRAW